MIKLEQQTLAAIEGYDATKNKVYIGGFKEGGVMALATYLKMDEATVKTLGGVVSIGGM